MEHWPQLQTTWAVLKKCHKNFKSFIKWFNEWKKFSFCTGHSTPVSKVSIWPCPSPKSVYKTWGIFIGNRPFTVKMHEYWCQKNCTSKAVLFTEHHTRHETDLVTNAATVHQQESGIIVTRHSLSHPVRQLAWNHIRDFTNTLQGALQKNGNCWKAGAFIQCPFKYTCSANW